MMAICDACKGEYEVTHQCRVMRGDCVLVTYIGPPVPVATRAEILRAQELFRNPAIVDVHLSELGAWPEGGATADLAGRDITHVSIAPMEKDDE